jgi:hypothetical protein
MVSRDQQKEAEFLAFCRAHRLHSGEMRRVVVLRTGQISYDVGAALVLLEDALVAGEVSNRVGSTRRAAVTAIVLYRLRHMHTLPCTD